MYRQWRPGITVDYRADGSPHVAVCFDAAAFVAHGADLVRELGVRRLSLGKADAHMVELVAMPAFQQAEALMLHELGDAGALLLGDARLPSLHELVVDGNELGPTGVRALVAGGLPDQLRILTLRTIDVGEVGAAALATARFDQLEELRLRACNLGEGGAAALAASAHLGRLRHLDLGGERARPGGWRYDIPSDGARALAASRWLPAAETVVLSNRALGSDAGVALATMPGPGPVDLDLCDNGLDARAIQALAAAPWTRLRRLGLSRNSVWTDHDVDSFDWDGSLAHTGPAQLDAREISWQFRFAARGVDVY